MDEWADLHPPESIHDAATFRARGCEAEEQIAGDGGPSVAEFCAAELGAALGTSTTSAKRLVGHADRLVAGAIARTGPPAPRRAPRRPRPRSPTPAT